MYLAGVKDLYSKELVGYAINKRMIADLVCSTLNMAIKNKRLSQELIVHSDRGSQYCSHPYHKIIKQHQFVGSMSAKGNCFDNAPIESFSGEEPLAKHCFAATQGKRCARSRTRIQKGLDYKTPRQMWFDYHCQAA